MMMVGEVVLVPDPSSSIASQVTFILTELTASVPVSIGTSHEAPNGESVSSPLLVDPTGNSSKSGACSWPQE
jgi:hypothetical protein